MEKMKLTVFGAGAWGTTLARIAALNEANVEIWSHEEEVCQDINSNHENCKYLPGISLPPSIKAFSELNDLSSNIKGDDNISVIACPSRFLREVSERISPSVKDSDIVLVATKGIEESTYLLPSQVVAQSTGLDENSILALSGPNLAREIAVGMPSAAVVAGNEEAGRNIQKLLSGISFRLYTGKDITGVQLGGALKNIMAIAAGICDGLELGINAKSALLARGLAEMTRMGVAMGADPLTFSGLSGMGDMVATSFSDLSRNRTFGEAIARGGRPEALIDASIAVVEGYYTVQPALALAQKHGVELPVASSVAEILFNGDSPLKAMRKLMQREPRPEIH